MSNFTRHEHTAPTGTALGGHAHRINRSAEMSALRAWAPALPAQSDARPHLCPTCLVPAGSTHETAPLAGGHVGLEPTACPDCGVRSLDYALLAAFDAELDAAGRLEALDAALYFAA